jgi:hypothetical protein
VGNRLGNNARTTEQFDTESVRALEFASHSALAECGRTREADRDHDIVADRDKIGKQTMPGSP